MKKQTAIKIGAIFFTVTAIGGVIVAIFQFAAIAAFWAALGKGLRAADYVPDYSPPKTLFGCIDRTGKIVLPFTYINLSSFHEGLAASFGTEKVRGFHEFPLTGYIDKTGKMVIPQRFLDAHPFSEGLAAVREDRAAAKWSYINKAGQQTIPEGYSRVEDFQNGQAFVERVDDDGSGDYNNRVYHQFIIDKNNKILNENAQALWDKKYASSARTEGLQATKAPNELYGFVDQTGKFVIKPQFSEAQNFSQGLAAVCVSDQHWGFIDEKGRLVIPAIYVSAQPFSEGLAVVEKKVAVP